MEKSDSKSVGEVLSQNAIKPIKNGGMSPLAQENKKRELAEELTGLSERMGVKKFIELKTKELGNKGFVDCSIDELQSLVSVATDIAPKINPDQAKKNQELFETVIDKFDGEVIR